MHDDTITRLPDPSGFAPDALTEVIRAGARKLIEQAIEAELAALLAASSAQKLADSRARLVRHGTLPEREVLTGIGPVAVKVPRLRDRGTGEDKISFTPSILPRYLRKAKSVEELVPWLYLKGVSTGDFTEALATLLGPNAQGLSATTITRLKADWWHDYEAWQKRDLGTRRFLYIWADGVYFKPRMAEEKQCVLVIVGADEYGRKELLAMTDGFRESTQSWREVLLDLRRRGLKQDPKLAIGDGALEFWTALREVFATTREQRCWVHKTMNTLNALPQALERQGHLRPDDGWLGCRGSRSEDRDNRRDLSQGAPHGDQPAVEKGGPSDQRGRLIGRTKGGMNTKLHAVADADGRPILFFMTAGQVSDYTGAAALLGSLPKADWLLADRGYDADWFRDALKDKGIKPCIPGRKSRGEPIKRDKRRYKRRNWIEIMFGRLKDWRRVATRYDRCPKVFLSAVALAATVTFWL